MKLIVRSILLLAVGVLIGYSVRPSPAAPVATDEPLPITDSPAEIVLERSIDEFRLDGVPLRLAVEKLADKARIVIEADWAWLAKDHLRTDAPITLNRRGEKLVVLLRQVLDHGAMRDGVWIEPHGDRIRLWSGTEPNPPVLARIYDLGKLIPKNAAEGVWGQDLWSRSDDVNSLRQTLERNVLQLPDRYMGWLNHELYEIAPGRLLLTQRWEVHRQVRTLLAELQNPSTPTAPVATKTPVYTWNQAAGVWLLAEPQALETALDKPMPELRLNEVTFTEAVTAFGKASGMVVEADYAALKRNSEDITVRQTIVCPPGAVGDALDRILARPWAFSRGPPRYMPHDGGIRITIDDEAEPTAYFRYYDLRDWPPYKNEVKRTLPLRGDSGNASPTTDALVKALIETAVPDSWSEVGGPWASIQVTGYQGVLLVRQTVQGHRQVRKYLAAIRSLDDNQPKSPIAK